VDDVIVLPDLLAGDESRHGGLLIIAGLDYLTDGTLVDFVPQARVFGYSLSIFCCRRLIY